MNFETAIRNVSQGHSVPFQPHPLYDLEGMSQEQLHSLAELGFLRRGHAIFGSRERAPSDVRQAMKAWVSRFVDGKRANAAFFDTTTLVTADRLINSSDPAAYLSPATLLDLSTFVNGVVLFDRVFHLENPHVLSHRFNEALGNEEVFVELPLGGSEDDEGRAGAHAGVREALLGAGYEAAFWNRAMRTVEGSELGAEDKRAIEEDWGTILGRRLTTGDVFPKRSLTNPDIGLSELDWTDSNGPLLLRTLIGETVSADRRPTAHRGEAWETSRFILECNHRSVFNFLVAYSLQLPHTPSVARVPFHRFLFGRARTVQHHLATLRQIEGEHRRATELYSVPNSDNLVLPFLLAVVLAQTSSLSNFLERLAELRENAEPLRRHRAELDEALYVGDIGVVKRLRAAFEEDAVGFRNRYALAPLAGGVAAVLTALGSATPPLILATIGALTAASLVPPDVVGRLEERIFRPQFWVLHNMADTTNALTNVLDRVERLWGAPRGLDARAFVDGFDRLTALRYA